MNHYRRMSVAEEFKPIHKEQHPLWGKSVEVDGQYAGHTFFIEDWWDRVDHEHRSWRDCGLPACLEYAIRRKKENLPDDDEVVYGKFGGAGKIMHISQIQMPFGEALEKI